MAETVQFRLQPRQELWLSSPADIAVMGGAAGGGKTWGLLHEPLRHIENPGFAAVLFRRTCPEITNVGGMWPESQKIYPYLRAVPNQSELSWQFPSGSVVKFGHMQHEKDMHNYLGAQIPLLGFDQLERFDETPFFFMLSRNRSVCGMAPYVRATANPQPGWLADFLSWWINQETGYPIEERSGLVRWFVRHEGQIVWANYPGELQRQFPGLEPKSVTFVPAKLTDNPKLMAADPGYLGNLQALPRVEQERLLHGNWKVMSEGSEWPADYFDWNGFWFDDWPPDVQYKVIALDPSKGQNERNDYSAFVILGIDGKGMLWVDAELMRAPAETQANVMVRLAQEHRPWAVGIESVMMQELFLPLFKVIAATKHVTLPLFALQSQAKKEVRLRKVGPYLARREIRFRRTVGGRMVVDQAKVFPMASEPKNNLFDDGLDSLQWAIFLLRYMLTGKRSLDQGEQAPKAYGG